jgi:hypothetical protein
MIKSCLATFEQKHLDTLLLEIERFKKVVAGSVPRIIFFNNHYERF